MIVDSPKKASTIFIIDVSNASYRAYYAHKELRTSKGVLSGHVFGAIQMLLKRFGEFSDATCPIFCYDGSNARASRMVIYPDYKGNRTQHDFCPVSDVKELCLTLPGLHIEQAGLEGDDSIVWATLLNIPKNTVIYTGDADLIHLMVYNNVKVYSPNKGRFIEKADWLKEYHVEDPSKIHISKALFGDKSDNIYGVDRLIKKQVEPILNNEKVVDISSFYDMLSSKPESMTEKMYNKTIEAKDRVFMNYEVIKPRIAEFTKSAVKQTIKSEQNKAKLLDILRKYECVSVINTINSIYN